MSGISAGHNKFVSCKGCPDRCAEPNCHDTCRGNMYRKKIKARQRDLEQFERRSWDITRGFELMKRRYKDK